jgi:hypothetical protein
VIISAGTVSPSGGFVLSGYCRSPARQLLKVTENSYFLPFSGNNAQIFAKK